MNFLHSCFAQIGNEKTARYRVRVGLEILERFGRGSSLDVGGLIVDGHAGENVAVVPALIRVPPTPS